MDWSFKKVNRCVVLPKYILYIIGTKLITFK